MKRSGRESWRPPGLSPIRAVALEEPGRNQMTSDDTTKHAALKLLERGLVTKSEAAKLAGVSRMLMQHWAREIDVEAARGAVLLKLWGRSTRRG